MIPLGVMLVAIFLARGVGALGWESLDSWHAAARVGLAIMFTFTGVAHFNRMRAELVRMVPARLGHPELWVTLTGIAELAGAVGLLVPATARWAALALALLLVALFPANVHAARAHLTRAPREHPTSPPALHRFLRRPPSRLHAIPSAPTINSPNGFRY